MFPINPTFSVFMARLRRAMQDYFNMDETDDIHIFIERQQPVFAELLTRTAGVPHGRNPLTQEDDLGAVWEFITPLSQKLSYRLLEESSGGGMFLLPQEQEFVIFNGDGAYIWALYASSDAVAKFGVIRAPARRYYELMLRGKYNTNITMVVLEVLRQMYGYDTLPPPPLGEGERDTLTP